MHVVDIEHGNGGPIGFEQSGLGLEIPLGGFVEVQVIEPVPAEPYFNSPGLAFASSRSCLMVLKRESAFTAIMNG